MCGVVTYFSVCFCLIARRLLQAVEWAGGTIDLLVNNAGIAELEDFMDVTVENFDDAIAVNTRAPLLVSQVIHAC